MSPSSSTFAGPQLARWRPLLEVLSLALQIALLVTTAGICVSASGTPREYAGNTWGRVDEVASRMASWEFLAVVAIGLLLVLVLRLLFEWPESVAGGRARAGLILALVNLSLIGLAAVLGIAAYFLAEYPETREFYAEKFYTGVERSGETIYNLGILVGVVVVALLAVRGFRVIRSADTPPPVGSASTADAPPASPGSRGAGA